MEVLPPWIWFAPFWNFKFKHAWYQHRYPLKFTLEIFWMGSTTTPPARGLGTFSAEFRGNIMVF